MNTDIEEKIKSMDFLDTVEVLKTSINRIKSLSDNDVDFKRLLGEIVSLSLPKLEGNEIKETKIKQMELIYRCQYRQLSSFEQHLMELFYKASEDNRGLLAIAFPFEAEAFKKYGRTNVNYLKMEIDGLKEELKINNYSIER